jgi:hypothetical protein
MVNKKNIFGFLILLITAISLSPRFSLGFISGTERSIDLRVEDIILCFGLLVLLFYFLISGKYKFKLPPLFWPIITWSVFGFLSVLVSLMIGNVSFKIVLFYFLKEIEFFILYFIVYYCILNSDFDLSKKLIKYWIFFVAVNILWLIYVFIFNVKWSMEPYGPNIFMEPSGPFPSGGFLLFIFIFLFNLFIFYYSQINISKWIKTLFIFLCLLIVLGIMWSGSMAATLGLFLTLPITFFLRKISLKAVILALLILCVLFLSVYALPVPKKITSIKKIIFEYSSGSSVSRGGIFRDNLNMLNNNPINLILGVGVSGEAHSQYMRVVLERGVVGLCLFFWLMWSILKISFKGFKESKDLFAKGLCAGLFISTIAMLIMGIPNDVFMVVKPDEVFWFFAAMTLASISLLVKNKEVIN